MNTPHYVVKKIGDRYVPVLQEPYPQATRAAYVGWGALLALLGIQRRGAVRSGLLLGGIALALRGAFGSEWFSVLTDAWRARRPRDGQRNEGPSYQNDFDGRAPQLPADMVDEQVMESFPASDPPGRNVATHP